MVLPCHGNFVTSAGLYATDAAGSPGGGQGGQELDVAVFALEEGFRHAGGAAEVAIYLERRMIVEQVAVDGFFKQGLDVFEDLFPLVQAGVEINDPRAGPARVAATVREAVFQRFAGAVVEFRRMRVYLRAGIEAKQVGDVPVAGFRFLIIFDPLHDAAVLPEAGRRQLADDLLHRVRKGGVPFQYMCGRYIAGEELAYYLVIHGGAVGQRLPFAGIGVDEGIFRGISRGSYQVAFRAFHEEIFDEAGMGCHGRKSRIRQEREAAVIIVMVPVMQERPRGAHWEGTVVQFVLQAGFPEGVRGVVERPAAGAVHFGGGDGAFRNDVIDEVHQRGHGFREVAGFRLPVVHLEVDVGMEVRLPGRVDMIIPDALQVGRQLARRAGGADEQVPAVLEQQRGEVWIVGACLYFFQALVRREVLRIAGEVELHSVHEGGMVLYMVGQELGVGGQWRFIQEVCGIYGIVEGEMLEIVVRSGIHHEEDGRGVGNLQAVRLGVDAAAFVDNRDGAGESHMLTFRPLVRVFIFDLPGEEDAAGTVRTGGAVLILVVGAFAIVRAGEEYRGVDGASFAGTEFYKYFISRGRCESLLRVGDAVTAVTARNHAGSEVQFSFIVRVFLNAMQQVHVHERLIGAEVAQERMGIFRVDGDHIRPGELDGFRVFTGKEELPYGVEYTKAVRVGIVVMDTGPEAFLVDLDGFGLRMAVHHSAEAAVAYRQGFHPFGGGLFVPEL